MNFKELLAWAKEGEVWALEAMLELYKPLLVKESILDGIFDEDLYQEFCMTLLKCVGKFSI